jgi:hypothetical protein
MMFVTLMACAVAGASPTWPNRSIEVRRVDDSTIVAVTNPSSILWRSDLLAVSIESGAVQDRFSIAGPDRVTALGPVAWGLYDEVVFDCSQYRSLGASHTTRGQCQVARLVDRVERVRSGRQGLGDPTVERRSKTTLAVGTNPTPLHSLQFTRGAYLMTNDIPYWFDITYSEETDLITIAIVCEGVLEVSTCEPGLDNHDQWTTVASVPTRIDGPFQVLHAAGEQFVIDSSGDLFVGLDKNHARIGSIPGWPGHSGIKATLLFEDRDASKIGVIQVTRDDVIEVIAPGSNDQRAVEGFMTSIDDDGLRRAILSIAEVVDEG